MQITKKLPSSYSMFSAIFTAAITFLVFMGALHNDFVDLDDLGYIVENRHLDDLNWQTIVWAFTSFHEANWHPVTMLSLALDRQIWGESPFGFHLVNITIHSATVFVCCYIFFPLLKADSVRSRYIDSEYLLLGATVVAALFFGIHPLRVESVVWASERKDVLCLLFIVIAIWWHLRYINRISSHYNKSFTHFGSYWMVVIMSCLALMSKPAAVSLPLLLLLIDFYPLARIVDRPSLLRCVYEKIPLLIISIIAAGLTVLAQQYAITMAPEANVISRLLIAAKAVVYYLWKMLWPANLAPFYPHPGNVMYGKSAEYVMYLATVCICIVLCIYLFKKRRQMWSILALFYLITLLPMLGIIQVGGQWIADRYTYLPALGISLFWGGGSVLLCGRFWHSGRKRISCVIGIFIISQLTVYAVMTRNQIKVWRNNETLATREIELFPLKSGAAYYSRAKYRKERGDCHNALIDIDNAIAIALRNNLTHKYADLSMSRAEVFVCLGQIPEAITAAEWAIQTSSDEERAGYVEYRSTLEERFFRPEKPAQR